MRLLSEEIAMLKTSLGALIVSIFTLPALAGPVSDAAKKGDVAELERLLDAGGDVNETDSFAPPLHLAAMIGHVGAVQLLAARGANLNATSSLGTPLHAAVQFGKVEAIRALLSVGADPDARDNDGYTPLIRAASRPSVQVVEALIAGGADVDAIAIGKSNQGEKGPLIALHEANLQGLDETASALRAGGAGPITPEIPSDLASLGDPERGRELAYSKCNICHTISADDVPNGPHPYYNSVLPTLVGIIGRPVASISEFEYSEELISYGGIWTPERIYEFALTPMLTVPGTRMDWAPDRTPEMIADIVAYLVSEAE
jgi:cytochrome c2